MLLGKSTSKEVCNYSIVIVVSKDLTSLSYGKLMCKTGQEPWTLPLQEQVGVRREKETLLEDSTLAEHHSIGDVERANRDKDDQARSLKNASEEKIGETIPPESPVLPCLAEHSAWLHNHCHDGRDAMTASEREQATKSAQPLAEFGELVFSTPVRLAGT